MRRLPSSLRLLLVALLTSAPAARAQVPPPTPPQERVSRVLPVVVLAFVDTWKPSPNAGALYQLSLGKSRVVVEEGIPVTHGPTVYLHLLAAGGVFRDEGDRWRPRAFGEVGVVRRTNRMVTAWGAVAHGVTDPWGIGPAARVELLDNLGLAAGWTVAGDSRSRGPFVSVDVSPGVIQLLL